MYKKLKKIFSNYQYKMLLYIVFPFILSILIFSLINNYFLIKLEDEVFNKYNNSLSSLANDLAEELNEIYQTSIMLKSSNDFFDIHFSNTPIPDTENYKFSHTVTALKNFKLTKNYIYSINIIDKVNNKVIGSNGTVTFDYFFDNDYFGEFYNKKEFWLNLEIDNNQMKILPIESLGDNSTKIIPLVFFNIGGSISKNPLVVNINKDKFSNFLLPYQPTENSQIFLYNSTTKEILSSTSNTTFTSNEINYLINESIQDYSIVNINGNKFFKFNYSYTEFYNDTLEYVMLIPTKDIGYLHIQNNFLIMFFIWFVILLGLALCFIISSKLYAPIKNLSSLFANEKFDGNSSDEDSNELNILSTRVKNLIADNTNLKNDVTALIPSVCEKYILDIIQQDNYDFNQLEPLLSRYNFSFLYNNFTTALIEFHFSEIFHNTFTIPEQNIFIDELITDFKTLDMDIGQKFVLTLSKNKFCIILNSDTENQSNNLKNNIVVLENLINSNNLYLTIYSGIGQTYKDLIGIHKSWKEANQVFSNLSDFSDNKINIYKNNLEISTGYSITASEDNYIFNFLISGNIVELTTLIKNIISRNVKNSISENDLKDLYLNLYSIGIKVVNIKKVAPSFLMNDNYIDIIRYVNTISINELANYIKKFFKAICIYNLQGNNTCDINLKELKKYIDNNYTRDIYLDYLAEKYNVDVKYMSKLLKKVLGIPFKQYITNLRILKAKELLSTTEDKIENIAIKVGFNSRNTFIRAFKLLEGITPSEYRKNQK